MDGINNTGNSESLKRIENEKTKKSEDIKESRPEKRTGDLSAQMAYLGAINRVNINNKPSSDSVQQENISFKGSANSDKELKPLSDEEFENLKNGIEEKLNQNPKLQKYISSNELNKNNILLADKILSEKKLYEDPDFMAGAGDLVYHTETQEQATAKCKMIDKILSDERLSNNTNFMKQAGGIVYYTDTIANAQVKCDLIDKILSEKKLYQNPDFMESAGLIVYSADTLKGTKAKCEKIDEILSDEKLFNNRNFMKNINYILISVDTPEKVRVKCDLIDKLLSSKKLYENSDFMRNAGEMVYYANTPEQAKIADKILSDERLSNNTNFMKEAVNIIYYADTPEKSQAKCDLIDKILSDERLFNNHDFMKDAGGMVYYTDTIANAQVKCEVIDKYFNDKEFAILPKQLVTLLYYIPEISYEDFIRLNKTIGKENASELSYKELVIASKFLPVYNKQNINEIPLVEKRNLLRNLVACNSDLFEENENLRKMFPLLPKDQEEYCELLPAIVRSAGIETNTLSDEEVESFNESLNNLGAELNNISDEEFNNLDIKQEYSKDDFIFDTLEKVKDLTPKERQKVYDYFGFELHHSKNNKTGFSITGYPVNLNNGKKLAQITDPKTKEVVENLRENVIHFSENNHITCNNEKIETLLNETVTSLPELRPMIGRTQSPTHAYDVMQHSLKVMKSVVQNPEFDKLNDSDQKVMLLASLLHDITKREGIVDKTHENEGSFDSYYIAKKFNLTKEEEIKLNTLIKNHEWLGRVNTSEYEEELTAKIQSTAYDLRHDNLFDMSLIFTHADLKAVNDSFHDTKEGKSRIDFNGNVRSFGESADYYAEMIKDCIKELQKSQPILPTTKLPSSDEIKSKIANVNSDGSTNIKGVYEDKDGAVIIKYNEVEDWEAIGFSKGSISKGIETTTDNGKDIDTGNIKFIAHGLDFPNQLARFDAFSLIDSDALLSVSYMERPESKYRLFRPQGVLLDVDTKYIHGGGETDSGSGHGKNIQMFKDNYIFGAERENDRLFISNLIKEATGMNDEEYVKFVEGNANKSFEEIEPVELREKLIKAFASINSHKRRGERAYNEMYISNPNKPIGVFAYNEDSDGTIGNPVDFLNSAKVSKRTDFIKQYAIENNIPFVIFGD